MTKIAIIGSGLVGRAWAIVFARGGLSVSLWDPHAPAVSAALDFIARRLPELEAAGLLRGQTPDAVMARLFAVETLEAALDGAIYAQENGPDACPIRLHSSPAWMRSRRPGPSSRVPRARSAPASSRRV